MAFSFVETKNLTEDINILSVHIVRHKTQCYLFENKKY